MSEAKTGAAGLALQRAVSRGGWAEVLEKRAAEWEGVREACFRGLVELEEDEPEVEVTEEDVMATHRMWAARLLRAALGYEWPWPSDGAIDRLARYLREQGIQLPPESVTEEVDG